MAKTKKAESKELAQLEQMNTLPDYITGKEKTGLESLGRDDFKVQRIKLLQPLSPEVRAFAGKALPSEYWHTGANISLGQEFYATPIIVNKKVILFPPRDSGDQRFILAYSRNGLTWETGGNQEFEVTLKDSKKKVIWRTGKDVNSSGLTRFGSSDPEDNNSQPAAMLYYEYLLYLRDFPELSPAVLSAFRTGTPYAQSFNTYLASRKAPINCNVIKFFAKEETKGKNVWHVTGFQPAGNAPREIFELTESMKEKYAEYDVQIDREDMQAEATELKSDDI